MSKSRSPFLRFPKVGVVHVLSDPEVVSLLSTSSCSSIEEHLSKKDVFKYSQIDGLMVCHYGIRGLPKVNSLNAFRQQIQLISNLTPVSCYTTKKQNYGDTRFIKKVSGGYSFTPKSQNYEPSWSITDGFSAHNSLRYLDRLKHCK